MTKPRKMISPLNFMRDNAYAAGMPQINAIIVEPPAINTEFSMYFAIGARSQISAKLDQSVFLGRIVPWAENISERSFNAVHNMAKYG